MSLIAGIEWMVVILALGFLAMLGNLVERRWRAQGLDQWVPTYVAGMPHRCPDVDEPLDVFIAVCDHYEPETGKTNFATALSRVDAWAETYPQLYDQFRDVDGRPPQHTFFYPQDEYRPEYLDRLAPLIRDGYGDVDVHLHHHDDTPDGFREKLEVFRNLLYHRHGLLRKDPRTGEIVYGFIHGNWSLCNSRRDGCWCGVDHELPILLDTGCYADFTFPSAPSDTQPQTINQIYYAFDQPGQRKSHNRGRRAIVGRAAPEGGLLMIQGPLRFDWGRRKWGLAPRIENGDLLSSHPPRISRLDNWLSAGVVVGGRPDWRFVKLHTHGCKPGNLELWLDGAVRQFHADLANRHRQHPNFRYHYVTAWEMAQLVHIAEQGSRRFPWQAPAANGESLAATAACGT
ncbi:MAG: hypothetical protein SFV23_03015 [Planctomycetaceae bacterium]|nr:hypothetical protein [Planctomycetaceae bacterium]